VQQINQERDEEKHLELNKKVISTSHHHLVCGVE